ncbi:MAG: NUDIX domain-containing protein [Treponema sp.]|nr:NUDIX domain-containing protein [Treponema sp.]
MDQKKIQNHFTATGIVFNSKMQILMIRHKKLNVWLPPGGHIEDNELPQEAVLREVLEETGIRSKVLQVSSQLSLSDNHCRELERPFILLLEDIEGDGLHNHIDMVFICKALSEELNMQKSEVNDIGWFNIDQIYQLETFENVIQSIKKAFECLQGGYNF